MKNIVIVLILLISSNSFGATITCEDLTNNGKEPVQVTPITIDIKSEITKISSGYGYTFFATEVPDSTGTVGRTQYKSTGKKLIRLSLKNKNNLVVAASLGSLEGPKFGLEYTVSGKPFYVLTCWPSQP